ncbi:hypothetical protein FFRU_220060 [Fructobacillus fructosus]|uniref:hypothetical protein n=1 Tax=Fructobacillus fructosus TaxID=1631 RepID=UPI0002195CAA|nr:hypothetical protein [Fructobacillus fructosus]KRN51703.1 hypothetical protein IV71_GL000541 [Fructobacillus fructosus KCTC 3544]GAP01997.1 hypothetical protein FFRU_220060 [Fructobacillus fructosus]
MDIFFETKVIIVSNLNKHTPEILNMLAKDWEQLSVEKIDGGFMIMYGRFSDYYRELEAQGLVNRDGLNFNGED